MPLPASIPGVVTMSVLRGPRATAGAPPTVVIELPHGATRTADYTALKATLRGDYPDDLVAFFHVNTDVGSPELADAVATRLVTSDPSHVVVTVRSHVPRTFVDCNRVIDAPPEAFKEGKVTPGVPPWIRDRDDLEHLRTAHAAYVEVARAAVDETCGHGGVALFLHTYAPRSVDVEVDAAIVANLRRAYLPDVEPTWPLRPEVDVIGRALDGTLQIPAALLEDLTARYAAIGVPVADGRTYPLHPSTWAFHHAARWPGRALCVEIRRDLVADPWDPFVEMRISPEKAARMAAPLADALLGWKP